MPDKPPSDPHTARIREEEPEPMRLKKARVDKHGHPDA